MGCFIGMNDTSGRDQLLNKCYSVRFGASDGGDGAALPLACNDNNPSLAGLMDCEAAIKALLFEIGGADMAAEISAIDLDRTGEGSAFDL